MRLMLLVRGGHGSGTAGFGFGTEPKSNGFDYYLEPHGSSSSTVPKSTVLVSFLTVLIDSGRFQTELEPSIPTGTGIADSRFQNWWNRNRTGFDFGSTGSKPLFCARSRYFCPPEGLAGDSSASRRVVAGAALLGGRIFQTTQKCTFFYIFLLRFIRRSPISCPINEMGISEAGNGDKSPEKGFATVTEASSSFPSKSTQLQFKSKP
ncbi:hypothetical protein JCGZ_16861 [Jatropha curcas]|uniref:Uncharacterized protein n=1 Tax=Jatropha curcas TaxID=180498 RepID=A0A067LH86_JATCU|nr:hypothetical protein JCGZ_16861 [Jatropha curcas]